MVWLNLSPIPVGRRGVISSFKWFLPLFATRRGRGKGVGALCPRPKFDRHHRGVAGGRGEGGRSSFHLPHNIEVQPEDIDGDAHVEVDNLCNQSNEANLSQLSESMRSQNIIQNLKGHGNEADFLGFLQKLGHHRSLTLPFEPFRFWLRIRRDIHNRKTTHRLAESGSRLLNV
jgi:hypothetical protein